MELALCAAAFAAGIAVSSWVAFFVFLSAGVAALFLKRRAAAVLLASALAGALAARAADRPPLLAPAEPIAIEGTIDRPPERDDHGRTRVIIEADGGARIQVTCATGSVDLLPGDRVRFSAKLHAPGGFANPDAFDAARAARARGVDLVAGVRDASDLIHVAAPPRRGPWRAAGAARAAGVRFVERVLPAGEARALVLALTLGDRGEIPGALDDDFRAAGVTHVLSVSGLHLAVAAFLFFGLVRRLLLHIEWLAIRIEARRLAAALSIPAVWGYALVTGAALATLRSAVMATAFFLGIALGRRTHVLAATAAAALVLLGASPLSLYEPSLQLTFAAILGLAIVAPKLAPAGSGWLRRFLAASTAATLATAPIAAYHFHQIAPAALIGNLLVVPLCELLVLPVALGALTIASILPTLGGWLVRLAALGARMMAAAAHFVAHVLPGWQVGTPTVGQIGLYYGVLAACVLGRRRWAAIGIGLLVGWIGAAQLLQATRTDLVATFLDVGQGDAAVFELPHGHAMLVDAGGSFDPAFDPGELVVEPFLRRRHISRLDLVVMSHPHPDHMNGLPRILERFDVGELWEPGETSEAPAYRAIRAAIERRHIAHGPPGGRDFGGAQVEVLGPRGGASMARSTNDNSLVLRLSWAGRGLLLPGDVERQAEGELLAWGSALRADVLKAPHHGSRTSSTPDFLAAVSPRFAVFPAGAGNRFGFPHPEVLARYPCPIRITGRDGAVTVRIGADGSLGWSTVRTAP